MTGETWRRGLAPGTARRSTRCEPKPVGSTYVRPGRRRGPRVPSGSGSCPSWVPAILILTPDAWPAVPVGSSPPVWISGGVGSRPKGVRSGISDGGAGLSRALLELAQRLGIDSDVEPHLRRSGRLVNRKCLGFVKKLVQLGGRDLVVVRHAYILPLPVALVAANLSSARLARRAHVPRVRVNRVRVEDDGEHAAAVRRSDHKNEPSTRGRGLRITTRSPSLTCRTSSGLIAWAASLSIVVCVRSKATTRTAAPYCCVAAVADRDDLPRLR